jgi:hypothetical protein
MKSPPAVYVFADQFARLEAARAYLRAAKEIVQEALDYERRRAVPNYVQQGLGQLIFQTSEVTATVQNLMFDMETDLAVENGQKETIYPPPAPTGAMRDEFSQKALRAQLMTLPEGMNELEDMWAGIEIETQAKETTDETL